MTRENGILNEKDHIILASGQSLNIGDTFYFVSPEWHDGTIEKHTVDSFWECDPIYGYRIRFKPDSKGYWSFVYQQFFERKNPTCFLCLEDAQQAADENLYSDLRRKRTMDETKNP